MISSTTRPVWIATLENGHQRRADTPDVFTVGQIVRTQWGYRRVVSVTVIREPLIAQDTEPPTV